MPLRPPHRRTLSIAALLLSLAAPHSRHITSRPQLRSLTYRIAAASSGKQSPVSKPDHGTNYISQSLALTVPFSSTDRLSGEDAFFMSHVGRSSGNVAGHVILGLADGVGGWRDAGVDPGVFSHGLCRYMAEGTQGVRAEEGQIGELRPKGLLSMAFEKVMGDESIEAGGSTATVAECGPDGRVEVANLGDSGFAILEPHKVAYTSTPQTHAFNTPYQLTKLTARMRAQQAIFDADDSSPRNIEESPSAADVTTHDLKPGSILLLATDGVWDNLDPAEILGTVTPIMTSAEIWKESQGKGGAAVDYARLDALPIGDGNLHVGNEDGRDVVSRVAYSVMHAAKVASLDHKRDGPFAREARRYYPKDPYRGGKVDDIAVVVALAIGPEGMGSDGKAQIKAKL